MQLVYSKSYNHKRGCWVNLLVLTMILMIILLLKLFILDLENKINVDQCIVVIGNTYSLSCTGSKCEFSIIQQLCTSLLIYWRLICSYKQGDSENVLLTITNWHSECAASTPLKFLHAYLRPRRMTFNFL